MEKLYDTYEECEKKAGLIPGTLPNVEGLPEKYRKSQVADFMLAVVCEAHNDGWEPNFNDTDEYKYSMWPTVDANEQQPTGFGLSYPGCDLWTSRTDCGSRHLLKSRTIAIHIQKQFPEICKNHFLFK